MKVSINGFGRIGKKLIKRCLGFEMKVFVYDPFVEKKIIENFNFSFSFRFRHVYNSYFVLVNS